MAQVLFSIPGQPKGKGRPKFSRRGNFVKTYTPEETASYENLVKLMYDKYCNNQMLEGAIRADIVGYFPIPASTSKKRAKMMEEGKIRYTKKIDCDNLAKVVLDALNNIAYKDDSQVCELIVIKKYGTEPKVSVRLTEIETND